MIRLDPMTQAEFEHYAAYAIEDYAQAHFRNGDCDLEEARGRSRRGYAELLPEGLATKDQFLFSVREDAQAEPVGVLWLALQQRDGKPLVYIYDIEIVAGRRGQGLGTQLLRLVDEHCRGMGVSRISLNVMGWNHGARALYERNGFGVTGIGMTKRLDAVKPS